MPLHTRLGEEASARASFNVYTDRDDLDRLAEALNKVERLFGRAPTTASTVSSVSH
jgi:selenocysteine lyase/cysteine desulfurase